MLVTAAICFTGPPKPVLSVQASLQSETPRKTDNISENTVEWTQHEALGVVNKNMLIKISEKVEENGRECWKESP